MNILEIIAKKRYRKELSKEEARKKLGIDNRPLILSFGGSLGARRVNESVAELIKWHNGTDKYYHIHGTGKVGYEPMKESLKDITLSSCIDVREYISDMDICMAAADLVISRAGAITLGEIGVCGKPSVLIPSPYVAENHQFHNAMTLKNNGAAEIIEEKDGMVSIRYNGNGFLYNMVRILTGTLIEVGRGLRKPEEMQAIIDAQDRGAAGFTAPAQGLYLVEVEYEI